MEKKEILSRLRNIILNILDISDAVITEKTTANDFEEWDSLSNIQIIVAVEKDFNIRFSSKEIISWENVGDIINCISSKL